MRIEHLNPDEQRVLRLAVNRLAEKGQWDLDALKVEFEELILLDAPIEITGFSPAEIDHVILGEAADGFEQGPLEPDPGTAVARAGDIFQLGPHRIVCGDATDPAVLARLLEDGAPARLAQTDEPYNVKIAGHVTGGGHREFAVASGEMTDAEFLAFNEAWMAVVLPYLCDGGVFGTFIDWRGSPTVHSAATKLGLVPLNLIVSAKTNAGMGSLYRSQHELLPLFKKGTAPHVNNVKLGKRGRWRSNVWTYPGASLLQDSVEQAYFAFRKRLRNIKQANSCECQACSRMQSLDVKFVVHQGEFIRQKMSGREELAGRDVILVHRLLKNEVGKTFGARAYALYSDACVQAMGIDPGAQGLVGHAEAIEHIGETKCWVSDLEQAWTRESESAHTVVQRADAIGVLETDFSAPRAAVWDLITKPGNRLRWQGSDSVVENTAKGRRGAGTQNHCMHGKDAVIEDILDWRPFDHITLTTLLPVPGAGITALRRWQPLPTGQRSRP